MEYLFILLSIIVINLLLSGDNALVIALVCRNLSGKIKKKVIFWGSAGAIILRIILIFVAVFLLRIPFLQFTAGLLLLWISVRLAIGEDEHNKKLTPANSLMGAIKTIIIADLVMSIDNVIAIVAVAKGNIILLSLGLAMSIPIIIWGSGIIANLMKKWPIIITVGAGFLGWTAGEMMAADAKFKTILAYNGFEWIIPAVSTVLVVIVRIVVSHRKMVRQNHR